MILKPQQKLCNPRYLCAATHPAAIASKGQDQIPEWLVALFSLDFSTAAEGNTTLVYTPVWIPQLAMSIGTVLLAIALWDTLYRMLVIGVNPIKSEAVE